MSESSPQRFKVLFVDDERTFLDLARQSFADLSGGTWEVLTAPDAATTSVVLKEHEMDLIVLDVRMPEISGLQLIGILQKEYPEIPKVFLAAVVEESDRVAGLESGAALFLEKPTDHAGLQSVYATLSELLKWREKRGSSSATPRAGILDMVKLECSSKNSRVFEVFNAEVRGLVYVKEGAIVHAECPGRRGQSAFMHLTTLLDAEFSLRQFTDPPERSVVRQWEFLYLEAVQMRERLVQAADDAKDRSQPPVESSAVAAVEESAETAGTASTPVASPTQQQELSPEETPSDSAPAPTAPAPGSVSQVSDEEATRQLFRRPSPRPAEPVPAPEAKGEPEQPAAPSAAAPAPAPKAVEPVEPEEPLQLRMLRATVPSSVVASAKPGSKAAGPKSSPAVEKPGFRIKELLVCSYSAEVLYDWQCSQTEPRLKLVELARDRSERLSAHLPLGPVDRLEMQASGGRRLLHFQEDGAVFLHSSTSAEPSPPGPGQFHQSMGGWLARQSHIRGLLAAGVIRPPQTSVNQPVAKEFRREGLAVAWKSLEELMQALPDHGFDPWQLRWVFECAQLYVVKRQDGKALAALLSKDPEALDVDAVEKIFSDFKALQAA